MDTNHGRPDRGEGEVDESQWPPLRNPRRVGTADPGKVTNLDDLWPPLDLAVVQMLQSLRAACAAGHLQSYQCTLSVHVGNPVGPILITQHRHADS